MRKLLLAALVICPLFALAQKKALIETRPGEGSTKIMGMELAMVRGELRKAIVNHTGYEAFTRADIDQLMKEQDFQRTGNVSEEDIHKMGVMSGADYLCISTLNKSDNEFYLEAYLINVETGAISNPASQYGELNNGKLANMLPVCQALASELLGITTPIAQPIITTAPTSPMNQQYSQSSSQSAKSNASEDETPTKNYEVGSVITFDDGTKGVVFYVKDGHGLAVSLEGSTAKWENVKRDNDCHDLSLPNERGTTFCTMGKGAKNTKVIIRELGAAQAPAAAWCVRQGEGWYLPSAGELYALFSADGGSIISTALLEAGGSGMVEGWYWSSTEAAEEDVVNVSANGIIGSEEKKEMLNVRAVRQF